MKKFIKDNIIFGLSIILTIMLGLFLPNNNANRSIDYSLIKKHQILKNLKGKKVILTGGSNVLFGYDSKIIQENIKTPVVNHAIHAGYGLKYIIDDIIPFVKKGDVIVLSPEYSHFINNNYLGKEPLLFSLTVKPNNIKYLSFIQFTNITEYIPKFSFGRLKSFVFNQLINNKSQEKIDLNDYKEFSINEKGDHYTHWNKKSKKIESYDFNGEINYNVLNFLENANKIIKRKGGKLIISYPSISNSAFLLNENIIKEIKKELNKSNLKIIGTPKDYVFNDHLFYDTCYHLNNKGVLKRSAKLSNQLKTIIND